MVSMTLTDGYCPAALTVRPPLGWRTHWRGGGEFAPEPQMVQFPALIHKRKHSLRLAFHLHYGLWRQRWSQNDAPEDFPCCRTVYLPHLPGCVKSLTAKHAPSSILPKARAVMRDLSYPQMQTPVLRSPAPFKGAAHSLAEFYPMPSILDMVQE